MNTRSAIQPSNTPAVLSLAFSASRNRFIAGLSDGLRCFRTDTCLTTLHPTLPSEGGISLAEQLDDRYIAYVGGGKSPAEKSNILVFWDAVLGREITRFDLHEPILGIRLSSQWMVIILKDRTILFAHQELPPTPPPEGADQDEPTREPLRGPNLPQALFSTAPNSNALACLQDDLLLLPAQSTGQVHLIPLTGPGKKRVIRAHNTALRCMCLSPDGTLLATTSEQGTLIRVYSTGTLAQVAEFRRGVDKAIIYGLAFSDGNRWLATTSDKGTLHVFDLRAPTSAELAAAKDETKSHRESISHPIHNRVLSSDQSSALSGRSSPASVHTHQGSIQEYYGLRPPPTSASPPGTGAAVSAMAALKSTSFAPRILTDVRSVASVAIYTGSDPPHWQGGPAYSHTTEPNGRKKKVWNPVPALPNEPSGKPKKGLVAFVPASKDSAAKVTSTDDESATLYVIGGGSDARWEMFSLLPAQGGGWVLVKRGFRRYLTRQFVD